MNNREIKFRIWNKNAKSFILNDDDGIAIFDLVSWAQYYSDCLMYDNLDSFIVEVFTGIKDKNGKEIYEGDILEFSKLNYEVVWEDYCWTACCPNYNRYHWPRFENFKRESMVSNIVGNIFENPELIK